MKRKSTKSGNLSAIYARLDAVRMSEADRAGAKAALAQADAIADTVLAIGAFAKRLFSARPLHPTPSAHS
jgi:hypothetical protein